MSAKRIHRTPVEYLKYLKGELTSEERHSFERDLEADSFDMEAMEGLERLNPGEAEEDLLLLHSTLNRRLNRRRRIRIYSIAASVASLLIVGTIFVNLYDFSPKSNKELMPGEETILREESASQSADTEKDEQRIDQGVPAEKDVADLEEITVDEAIPAGEKGQVIEKEKAFIEEPVSENEPVHVEGPVQKEAGIAETAGDRKRAEAGEDFVVPQKQAIEFNEAVQEEAGAAPAPAPVTEEVVSEEALPQRSQKKGKAMTQPSLKTTEKVSGIMVSSEDKESYPGAAKMVNEADRAMTTDMDSLDEVVVIGYGTGKEDEVTGAVRKVQLEKEENKYNSAEPEGGLDAFKMYIEEQIRFPAGDTSNMKGVVVLTFHVEADGTLSNIQTLRSPGEPFTEEAIRLLKEGPAWKPARNESGPADEVVRMRIIFKK
jgi:TonB family protein